MSRNAWSRRQFLAAAVAVTAGGCRTTVPSRDFIIDCHTHFYDPTRPQGVPWPAPGEKDLFRPVLPQNYKMLAAPLGIIGTVVVEASEWVADNDWVLGLAAREPFLKGFVGNLKPGSVHFRENLARFSANRLFRGIRVRDVNAASLKDPAVIHDLALLAEKNLSLDLNGGPELLSSVADLARRMPHLRIIIDHVSNVRIDGRVPPRDWREGMQSAAELPNVYCKVSGLVEGSGKRRNAPRDVNFYRPVLDHVGKCFGDDRLVFGSNWPVSELFADLETVHSIVDLYFREHGETVRAKVFAGNAQRFYGPLPR